ncbi:hypothetical protein, variant 1 [Aphanomyces invadans]|uniref:BZIP domain-containing protein n=1 Tax=Aphanomyces invadans TaxID=157072 RepID=A0A024TGW0_9STRA|nr:hypothetical protein, variant 1 [Aphanomyces invadans]XP_008878590.1 hypothetical protein H310_13027 [Aphanomyces invadans]ETV92816.1 hypothetical protein H310_13027 [Aphanomyces invadans]ETV92817.1 hypothetical protein, variant 1 [Aphanomyces invadans]|eukprot:XP_008878587.1 hypothetical protein, variant 1 [Aphanomyces invadans]
MSTKKTSEWRLEQCRTNQRRYRRQAQEGMRSLEEQVAMLTVETARLEGNLTILRSTTLLASAGAKLIAHYLDVFRHGLVAHNEATQVHLVRSIVATDAIVTGVQGGADAVLEGWRQYSRAFPAMELVQSHMDVLHLDSSQLVHCFGHIECRISRQTLETIYPHLLQQDQDLACRLLGQVLKTGAQIPVTRQYSIDNDTNQVTEELVIANFMRGLIDLLQSTEDAMRVMAGAKIDMWGKLQPNDLS